MPRVETEEEIDDKPESIPLYESYWAQNTTAHGVSRVANTTKWHRAVWILALLGCFAYVSYELFKSIETYKKHLTTTEINKLNRPEIKFPSVTFCNFNRWRKSHMSEEVTKQLEGIISLYSYDYVIPDLNDGKKNADDIIADLSGAKLTPEPVRAPTTTTEAPPVECKLPNPTRGLEYEVQGSSTNHSTVALNTNIQYMCVQANTEPMDGDTIHTCAENGLFQGRLPICVDGGEVGARYTLANNQSDNKAMAVSKPINATDNFISKMTLCFWLKTSRSHKLGTILSYGIGDETILSVVIQIPVSQFGATYGVKYKLFGVEGRAITLASFDQWNPFCLQYSAGDIGSQLFKFLVFTDQDNGFQLYSNDGVAATRKFPLNGNLVLFNDYQSYVNLLAGMDPVKDSSGGQVSNVNMWSRIIPIELMNIMLWHGDIYTMTPSSMSIASGSISGAMITFNVSVSQHRTLTVLYNETGTSRLKRQIQFANTTVRLVTNFTENFETNATAANITLDSFNSTSNISGAEENTTGTPPSTTTEETEEEFNYAKFTRRAGWQLVDDHSNHSDDEQRTLLSCKYRGKECNSRWFTHRFGAYGNCYTFNKDIPQSVADEEDFNIPLVQDNAGPTGGLNMLLDIQTWEYSESTKLNGNSELGLKFIVHAPYEVPVINSMGYAVGPGNKAFVGFQKTSVRNLEKPWGRCNESRKLEHNVNYTVDGCAVECRLHRVVSECGCKPYYYPGEFDICTFDELESCAFLEIAKVNADFGKICECPIACVSEEYNVKLSYTTFPNIPYGRQLGDDLNISLPPNIPGVSSYDNRVQYLKSNVISLDMYFESMSETEMKQNKAMDETALLSNIGGQLGLFIGCSFLTAFEFLECILMSALYHCKRGKNKRKHKKKEWLTGAAQTLEIRNGDPKFVDAYSSNRNNNNGALYMVSEPTSNRLRMMGSAESA